MRLAGVSSQFGYGNPFGIAGINVNQEDMPHWCTSILAWLSCYRAIQEGYGKVGEAYRQLLEKAMDGSVPFRATDRNSGAVTYKTGPGVVYSVYEDMVDALKNSE